MPNKYESFYNKAVLDARRAVYGRTGPYESSVRRIYDILARALADLIEEADLKRIPDDRFMTLKMMIIELLDKYGRDLQRGLATDIRQAMDMAVKGHRDGIKAAAVIEGLAVSRRFEFVPEDVIRLMAIKRGLSASITFRALIKRGLESHSQFVDDFIGSMLARGVSADRGAVLLARTLSANNPDLEAAIRELGKFRGRSLLENIRHENLADMDPAVVKEARQLLYEMRRITVSEINSAYNEADRVSAARSPMVKGLKWQLSGAHAGLPSSPDVCDILAEQDMHGLGSGVYYPETTPGLPHPHCGCSTSTVFRNPEEWDKPKDTPVSPRPVTPENVRAIFPEATEKFIERQVGIANRYAEMAHDAWKSEQSKKSSSAA